MSTPRSTQRQRFLRVEGVGGSDGCEPAAFRSALTLLRAPGRDAAIQLLENQIRLMREAGRGDEVRSWTATLRVLRSIDLR